MTILAITNAGGTTDQPNQTISVTGATPGASVEFFDNGTLVSTAVADSSGACAVPVHLAGGANSLVATDETTGASSNPVVFTFTPLTITETPTSGIGMLGSPVTISISGATPGATVQVFDNSSIPVGVGLIANANGDCATTTTALPAGTNNLVATDKTTGASSNPIVFTVVPFLPLITNAGGTTDQPNQTISVTHATPGASVEFFDNGTLVSTAVADSSGACAVPVHLAGGANSLVATDETTGASSNPVVFTFTPLTITETPTSGIGMLGSPVTISISGATPGPTFQVFDNSSIPVRVGLIANANGDCATTPTALPAGTNNLVATDKTTGASSNPIVFTVVPFLPLIT